MISVYQVQNAVEAAIGDYEWGYGNPTLTIDGTDYPIEWVEVTDPYQVPGDGDYTTSPLKAVFKVTLEGHERFFCKEGMYRSHYGTEWDGRFYECTPVEIHRVEYQPGTTVVNLSASDVEKAIRSSADYDCWDELEWSFRDKNLEVNGKEYPLEVLEENTGSEGDYSVSTYIIFKVGHQVFKKTGHYQSHYGNDWDGDLKEVKQVTKTVNVWEEA